MAMISLVMDVPPKTYPYTPVTLTTTAPLPIVLSGEISIAPGSAGLVGVRLYHRGHWLAPSDGSWLTGNARTISWVSSYPMMGPPFYLSLEAYNLDDTWAHHVECVVNLADIRSLRGAA